MSVTSTRGLQQKDQDRRRECHLYLKSILRARENNTILIERQKTWNKAKLEKEGVIEKGKS